MTDPVRDRLPNLVLPGFPKCGTTSVAQTLDGHPAATCARPHRATHFFTRALYDPAASIPSLGDYAEHYAHAGPEHTVRIDDTVIWAYGGERLTRVVQQTLGTPKVLVMLREPASRTASYLTWKKRNVALEQDLSLADYVDQCDAHGRAAVEVEDLNPWSGTYGSHYPEFLEPWVREFGDQLRVGFMEDLRDRPVEFYRALAQWLGIEPEFFTEDTLQVANPASSVRSARVEATVRAVGRRVQPLARRAPRLYSVLRDSVRRINLQRGTAVSPDETTLARLRERFAVDHDRTKALISGRTLLDPPAWLGQA